MQLMKSAEAMYGNQSYTAGGADSPEMTAGQMVKAMNTEAGNLNESDPEFADRLRRMALKVANSGRKR